MWSFLNLSAVGANGLLRLLNGVRVSELASQTCIAQAVEPTTNRAIAPVIAVSVRETVLKGEAQPVAVPSVVRYISTQESRVLTQALVRVILYRS
ncbi:hypothetical protein IQ268_25115 [Oculatella sp. LEGE 06141]|uniref:hypothetical protein n=1 Tax=Oculatella sp. LEGE 06141 TaxID=1828648 RepID=UPI00187E40A8|nr:hypothetical protein [Oculatella sp. LEGE 06141]MBE9181853.1 hypothetical protein [Oculatella sp. LEGE 06141]